MKNLQINKKLKDRIISGSLSIILVASGVALGKLDSKKNNSSKSDALDEYLNEYIEKRSALEEEIDSLLQQKEELKNSETFNISDLIVIEYNNEKNNQTNLYICKHDAGQLYHEYHNEFQAAYGLHLDTDEHICNACTSLVHFYEGQPLFNYLTDEEIDKIDKNDGEIATLELDEILKRIRVEYKEQAIENNNSKTLTKK